MTSFETDSAFTAPEPRLDRGALALLGAGPLARATARILLIGGTQVRVWARRPEARRELEAQVPGLHGFERVEDALAGAGTLFVAVPAGEIADLAERVAPHVLPDQVVLLASRGVSAGFTLPHEHIRAQTCLRKIAVFGGPLHARELEAGRRINVVIGSRYAEARDRVAQLTQGAPVAFHPTRDIVGVEVAGAIANVASLAAGMAEALGLGDTARGVLLARGIIEARQLGVALGASAETFTGLAGLGELIPRSVTSMDRHLELGRLLGEGASRDEALGRVDGHVEAVVTAEEGFACARERGLELPLLAAVAFVLAGEVEPRAALERILTEPLPLDAG